MDATNRILRISRTRIMPPRTMRRTFVIVPPPARRRPGSLSAWRPRATTLVAIVLLSAAAAGGACAADDLAASAVQPSNAELLKELQAMKRRIAVLEQELRKQKTTAPSRKAAPTVAAEP